MRCEGCGTELSATRLACPVCRRLTHQRRLEELSDEAVRATQSGRPEAALAAWREALEFIVLVLLLSALAAIGVPGATV
jgi:hypothetical protein